MWKVFGSSTIALGEIIVFKQSLLGLVKVCSLSKTGQLLLQGFLRSYLKWQIRAIIFFHLSDDNSTLAPTNRAGSREVSESPFDLPTFLNSHFKICTWVKDLLGTC